MHPGPCSGVLATYRRTPRQTRLGRPPRQPRSPEQCRAPRPGTAAAEHRFSPRPLVGGSPPPAATRGACGSRGSPYRTPTAATPSSRSSTVWAKGRRVRRGHLPPLRRREPAPRPRRRVPRGHAAGAHAADRGGTAGALDPGDRRARDRPPGDRHRREREPLHARLPHPRAQARRPLRDGPLHRQVPPHRGRLRERRAADALDEPGAAGAPRQAGAGRGGGEHERHLTPARRGLEGEDRRLGDLRGRLCGGPAVGRPPRRGPDDPRLPGPPDRRHARSRQPGARRPRTATCTSPATSPTSPRPASGR